MSNVPDGVHLESGAEEAKPFALRRLSGVERSYGRLAMERLVFDELQRMADPEAHRALTRTERRLRRDTGQRFFW